MMDLESPFTGLAAMLQEGKLKFGVLGSLPHVRGTWLQGSRSELSHCVRVGRLPYQDPGEVSFTALCLVHRLLSRSLVLPRRFQRVTRKGSNSAFLLGVANGPSASGTDALPWTCSYRHEDTPGRLAGQWHRG